MPFSSYLRIALFLFAVSLSAGYVFFSYTQASSDIAERTKALFLEEQREITEALHEFYTFLHLTESRLINSIDKEEKISSILSMRTPQLLNKNFPDLLDLTFTPRLQPTIPYSRYGKALHSQKANLQTKSDSTTYLGKGEFQLEKILYDGNKKNLGILQATFSIEHLLFKHFPEREVKVLSVGEKTSKEGQLSFTVSGLPYIVVLTRPGLSFWEYISASKVQIFTTLFLCMAGIIGGVGGGIGLNQKKLSKYRSLTQNQRVKLLRLEEEKDELAHQLMTSRRILKLKKQANTYREHLFAGIQHRYRQMAGQAQAIFKMTSKLILDETGNSKLMKEIHSISQESNSVLTRLINGFPMRGVEDNIDILESIENIRGAFLPEMTELNVKFEIKGKLKTFPPIDQAIFEIVLHNIFRVVVDRLASRNVFRIELKTGNPIEIAFYDDGFDVEDKLHSNDDHENENIMCLSKGRLREFITNLGWNITFQKEGELLNSISLFIPATVDKKKLPDNVVNLFDFGSHVS